MAQCPQTSIQSFPVDLGFTPTYEIYDSLIQPLNLDFTWGSGTDIPVFSPTASVQSGELYHSSFDSTRVEYNGISYVLISTQLSKPSHSKWLSLKSSEAINSNNQEDIILTFICEPLPGSTVNKPPQFIILVSPIIRINRPIVSSPFLTAFANGTASNVTPETLFPNSTKDQLAYYTSCAKGFTPTTDFQNVLVVVNVQGLLVWNNIMESIKSAYTTYRSSSYPKYVSVFDIFSNTPTTITDQVKFKSLVKVTKGYASSVQSESPVIETVTNSYKCVTLNPDTDISGGSIYIDRESGTILSDTLAKRQLEKDNYNSTQTAKIPYEILRSYTSNFLIFAFSIVLIFIFIYAILSVTLGESDMGSGASTLKLALANLLKVPVYVIIAFFCTFIGVFVGVTIAWSNKASVVSAVPAAPATPAVPATPVTPPATPPATSS
jgi:hypothetical protein